MSYLKIHSRSVYKYWNNDSSYQFFSNGPFFADPRRNWKLLFLRESAQKEPSKKLIKKTLFRDNVNQLSVSSGVSAALLLPIVLEYRINLILPSKTAKRWIIFRFVPTNVFKFDLNS